MFNVIRLGEMIKECPGKNHALYSSRIGLIRKPTNGNFKNLIFNNFWWEKVILFIKGLFKK